MLQLPAIRETNPNVLALYREHRETITGIAASSFTLSEGAPVSGTEFIIKNRLILTPTTDYTLDGNTVTLVVPAVAGDVFDCLYRFRPA